jgi:2-polyprenyl-3-methyl-5-hydroxy-6-metoxy-1,4-benzoquinol methylase
MPEQSSVFKRSGVAAVSAMHAHEYVEMFTRLEAVQNDFLSQERAFRSADYKWPRDPLHWWSRAWEYPYAYYHLQQEIEASRGSRTVTVVDLGSGVTFFPFAVARLGVRVNCLDIDPVCKQDLERAAEVVSHVPGSVDCALISDTKFPLRNGEVDAVYCISVLEHIEDVEDNIQEIARILRPGGMFILTIDLDLCGYLELGVARYQELREYVAESFELVEPEITTHPRDMLVQCRRPPWVKRARFRGREWARAALGRGLPRPYPNLTVWGGVMRKRLSTVNS